MYKIMSFNIKCDDTIAQLEPEQLWENRKENLLEEIIAENSDIIGMQEVMPHQQEFLSKNLENYASVYQNRDENAVNGEGEPVYYNKDKFNLVKSESFWLSETPNIPASTSWNSRWPRVCTYVVLEDVSTKQKFAYFNTHLDHKSPEARLNGIKLIISKINELNLPTILSGDFNSPIEEEAASYCSQNMTNANVNDKSITFHLFGHPEILKPYVLNIDYIFVKNCKATNYHVLNNVPNAVKNSDHYAIECNVEIE